MYKLISAGAVYVASAAWGLGLGLGVFGGAAVPTGDMATASEYDLIIHVYDFWPATGGLGVSPMLGGKFIVGIMPQLEIEAAVAYHLKHPVKSWKEEGPSEEPYSTIVPVTVGANYKLAWADWGVYFGAGAGYYFGNVAFSASWWDIGSLAVFKGEADVNKPGLYVGGGLLYKLGDFALDVNPRFHYIMNEGEYLVRYDLWRWHKTSVWGAYSNKPYNDTFVDVLVGVNYYFI